VNVEYTGVLPDLFKEGQGMVATGILSADGVFVAKEVLAKHDENYMSPEVKKMLEDAGHPVDQDAQTTAAADRET
jgi:cytochrome c-type biogenesis protein CcmE